jgi:hypothetical protein
MRPVVGNSRWSRSCKNQQYQLVLRSNPDMLSLSRLMLLVPTFIIGSIASPSLSFAASKRSAAGTVRSQARPGTSVEWVRFRHVVHRPKVPAVKGTSRATGIEPQPAMPPLIALPPVRQHSDAACGPSTLASIFAYYGKGNFSGYNLARMAGETYASGTDEPGMKRLAKTLGLKVKMKYDWSLKELHRTLQGGTPVAVGIQAWASNPKTRDWRATDDNGHYVGVIGIASRQGKPYASYAALKRDINNAIVWLMDPYVPLGKRGWLPAKEFMARWHWSSDDGKMLHHFGLSVVGDVEPVNFSFLKESMRIE